MSKVGRRRSGRAESGNGTAQDVAATGAGTPESAKTPEEDRSRTAAAEDGGNAELFGLNEEATDERPAEHWPTGAELTDAGREILGSLAGAGDWVLQLDGTDIEFADIERPADSGKGARIQMWDGSELIFDESPDDRGASPSTRSDKPRRG
jgi:hypothetical protein